MNSVLRRQLNWKNLCIIFSVICLFIGILIGKTFASSVIYADGTISQTDIQTVGEQKSYYAQGVYEQSATPVIPFVDTSVVDGTQVQLSLVDGISKVTANFTITYNNLNVTYVSDYNGFLEMNIAYLNNLNVPVTSIHTIPVRKGVVNYSIPNWSAKTIVNNVSGEILNHTYNNLHCVSARKIVIS